MIYQPIIFKVSCKETIPETILMYKLYLYLYLSYMKYVITENKMLNVFSKYIEKSHPELLKLTRRRTEIDYGYYLTYYDQLGNHYSIFQYLVEEDDNGGELRLLIVKSEFPSEIENMFGRKYLSLLKEWFESVYKLPVDLIEERI